MQVDSFTNASIYRHFLWWWVNVLDNTDLNLSFCCTVQLHDFTGDICCSKQPVKSNQLSYKQLHTSQLLFFSNRGSFGMSPVTVIKQRIFDIPKSWEKVLEDTSISNGCVTSTNAKWTCVYVSCCMHCKSIPSYSYHYTLQWITFSSAWIIPISLQVLKTFINPDFWSDITFWSEPRQDNNLEQQKSKLLQKLLLILFGYVFTDWNALLTFYFLTN